MIHVRLRGKEELEVSVKFTSDLQVRDILKEEITGRKGYRAQGNQECETHRVA